jgi:hypothetical protein
LDKYRRGSTSPAVGQGRRKDKRNYPGPQAEAEDNVHHGARQRGARYEETTGRTHHCTNAEKGASGSNGTTSRASRRSHYTGRGSQEIYGTDPGRVLRLISDEIRRTQGEDHAGSNTRSRAQGEVPGDHQGDRRSTQRLGGSG